jgi:hypothetical protein
MILEQITPQEFVTQRNLSPHRPHEWFFTGKDGLNYRRSSTKNNGGVYFKADDDGKWELYDFMKKHRLGTLPAIKLLRRKIILEQLA